MLKTLWHDYGHFLVVGAVALFAFGGWGGLAYSAMSSRSEIAQLRAERDEALGNFERLSRSAGDLNEVAAKLSRAKAEYDRTAQAWAEAKQKLAAVQQELAVTAKRPDPLGDLISQTGSVRPLPLPPKSPIRKPAN